MYAVVPPPFPGDRLRRAAFFVLSAYLALFLADGLGSLVDDALIGLAGFHRFSGLRNGVAGACFWASVVLLFLTALTPLLPRRFLYPPVAFTLLCDLLPPLFRAPLPRGGCLALDAAQLLLGLGIAVWAWHAFLPAPFAGRRAFSWRHVLLNGVPLLALAVPAIVLWWIVAVARQLEVLDGGFMLFHWNRLEMKTKKYTRADGKEIDLVPMIHIGESGFYGKVAASFPADTVVLTEGVTDRDRQAPHLDYTPVASAMGLVSQSGEFHDLARQTQAEIRPADVDYADFTPGTREMIGLVARFAENPDRPHYAAFVQEWRRRAEADPGLPQRFLDEILTVRNAHVLKEAEAALPNTGRVVLPWGALHMPGLEAGVLKMGFQPAETRSLDALHYRTLLGGMGRVLREPPPVKAAASPAVPD